MSGARAAQFAVQCAGADQWRHAQRRSRLQGHLALVRWSLSGRPEAFPLPLGQGAVPATLTDGDSQRGGVTSEALRHSMNEFFCAHFGDRAEAFAVEGKAMRGSGRGGCNQRQVHLLDAIGHASGRCYAKKSRNAAGRWRPFRPGISSRSRLRQISRLCRSSGERPRSH